MALNNVTSTRNEQTLTVVFLDFILCLNVMHSTGFHSNNAHTVGSRMSLKKSMYWSFADVIKIVSLAYIGKAVVL